jgi:adenylyltransferase/sulfurtransferase
MDAAGRYARQVAYFGRESQDRLSRSRVAVVGCGATGSLVAELLARAGVGRLTLIDRDFVEATNLHRGLLFDTSDVGMPKALAAKERLEKIHPGSAVDAHADDLNARTVAMLDGSDVVVECTDNMEARFLINDVCCKSSIPWVFGSVLGLEGMSASFRAGRPCFRCLFPRGFAAGSLETCETAGILSPAVGMVASWQALEAMKTLTGFAPPQYGTLFRFSLKNPDMGFYTIQKNPACSACVKKQFDFLAMPVRLRSLCGRNTYHILPQTAARVHLPSLSRKLSAQRGYHITPRGPLLHIGYKKCTVSLFETGRAIIRGPRSEQEAEKVYAKILGMK